MTNIRSIDMMFIDDIFEMGGGYERALANYVLVDRAS
jgi:hypothetical protein